MAETPALNDDFREMLEALIDASRAALLRNKDATGRDKGTLDAKLLRRR